MVTVEPSAIESLVFWKLESEGVSARWVVSRKTMNTYDDGLLRTLEQCMISQGYERPVLGILRCLQSRSSSNVHLQNGLIF